MRSQIGYTGRYRESGRTLTLDHAALRSPSAVCSSMASRIIIASRSPSAPKLRHRPPAQARPTSAPPHQQLSLRISDTKVPIVPAASAWTLPRTCRSLKSIFDDNFEADDDDLRFDRYLGPPATKVQKRGNEDDEEDTDDITVGGRSPQLSSPSKASTASTASIAPFLTFVSSSSSSISLMEEFRARGAPWTRHDQSAAYRYPTANLRWPRVAHGSHPAHQTAAPLSAHARALARMRRGMRIPPPHPSNHCAPPPSPDGRWHSRLKREDATSCSVVGSSLHLRRAESIPTRASPTRASPPGRTSEKGVAWSTPNVSPRLQALQAPQLRAPRNSLERVAYFMD